MRKLVVIAVVVLLIGAPAAAAAPVAQMGAAGFLAAEHPWDTFWGGPATDKQLTDIGLTACAFHGRGLSDVDVLTAMMGGPSMLPPAGTEARERGLQRVRNAVRYLCG